MRLFTALPYRVLVEWFLAVRLFILLAMSLLALLLVARLFYLEGDPNSSAAATRPPTLNTDLIDELEVWLEERQTESEQLIIPSSREYFSE